MLIDFGGSCLPGFVGGSRNIKACADSLRTLASADIAAAILTPKYYPAKMSVEDFVSFRYKILCDLSRAVPESDLHLYLGCEVYIDERLKYIASIGELAIRGTRIIIADMPVGQWEPALLDTLEGIRSADYDVLISHVDRYPRQYALDLFKFGYRAIADIDSFLGVANLKRRKQLLSWIDSGYIVGLATNFEAGEKNAREKISKMRELLGEERSDALAESGARILTGARSYPNFIY